LLDRNLKPQVLARKYVHDSSPTRTQGKDHLSPLSWNLTTGQLASIMQRVNSTQTIDYIENSIHWVSDALNGKALRIGRGSPPGSRLPKNTEIPRDFLGHPKPPKRPIVPCTRQFWAALKMPASPVDPVSRTIYNQYVISARSGASHSGGFHFFRLNTMF
jgi:hypothetical protein